MAFLEEFGSVLRSPCCQETLLTCEEGARCSRCAHRFGTESGIPLLFWPTGWESSKKDVTPQVQAFYEETPFPNYDDFDNVGSLIEKARRGMFAQLLDDQIPPGTWILDVGCGTGQMSNFLSIAQRTVIGIDICLNSLRLGQRFKDENQLGNVHFVQMNLFRPVFRPESFDLVYSNGVFHHTSDPYLAFKAIAELVKPGGYVVFGLYHRYGRLITDCRRLLFRLSGERFLFLDPNLRGKRSSAAKKKAWFMDQYRHPHESKHTLGEARGWLERSGFEFIKSIPPSVPFHPFSSAEKLFRPERPGSAFERFLVEMGMIFTGSEQGGFFVMIGRKATSQSPQRGWRRSHSVSTSLQPIAAERGDIAASGI